jgi:hypothetical protein
MCLHFPPVFINIATIMIFLPVPKLLKWQHSLSQTYTCDQKILVTSGCSFTSSTMQLDTPASWPGYAIDRCRFDHGIDYSYPGAGNDYIGDSILYHFSNIPDSETNQYIVVIMWSGIDRVENKISNSTDQPNLGGVNYQRLESADEITFGSKQAEQSFQKMLEVYDYLTNRKINFLFTCYSNLLFPPYIPKRDTTKEFDHWLTKNKIEMLGNLDWAPSDPMNYLYEYAFTHNYLNQGDGFHPPVECNLEWTDKILLPELEKRNFIHGL